MPFCINKQYELGSIIEDQRKCDKQTNEKKLKIKPKQYQRPNT